MWKLFVILIVLFASCQTTHYYIVRHGEKMDPGGAMSSDVPLSPAGEARAIALGERLKSAKIQYIYSTSYQRTKNTARPLAELIGAGIETYEPRDTAFVSRVLARGRGNALIVGHSNTVGIMVNRFLGEHKLQELADTAYGDLFIITRKGKKMSFSQERFGK
jgi:broad specificity phosphatase PhoE